MGTETESPHKIMMTEWNLEHQDQKLKIMFLRFFVLITNKRRVKILEILRDFRSDSVISKNVRNVQQEQQDKSSDPSSDPD